MALNDQKKKHLIPKKGSGRSPYNLMVLHFCLFVMFSRFFDFVFIFLHFVIFFHFFCFLSL